MYRRRIDNIGRVVIPRDIRESLGFKEEGQLVSVSEEDGRIIIIICEEEEDV